MLIKYSALSNQLKQGISPVYIVFGSDIYFLEQAVKQIKQTCLAQGEVDCKRLVLESASDWQALKDEANSFSLFHDHLVLDCYFEKKSLDEASKKTLALYLQTVNPKTTVIIRAYELTNKSLQTLAQEKSLTQVQVFPLAQQEKKQWIIQQFKQAQLTFAESIPDWIIHFTQGNMLACAQAVEKMILVSDKQILESDLRAHLSDQCQFELYDLSDACLQGKTEKALQILRKALINPAESSLVLWMLTQDIRLLSLCHFYLGQRKSTQEICSLLKIWPQKAPNYLNACKRLSPDCLRSLMQQAQQVDEAIKTGQPQVAILLEKLALTLSLGEQALCNI